MFIMLKVGLKVGGVHGTGVSKETRPKNMRVIFIIKVSWCQLGHNTVSILVESLWNIFLFVSLVVHWAAENNIKSYKKRNNNGRVIFIMKVSWPLILKWFHFFILWLVFVRVQWSHKHDDNWRRAALGYVYSSSCVGSVFPILRYR